ncbi:MAG TPA: c-type cytochrome domain-containing protein, partial [Cyclobacteriaceae bacterium]|nr:c-type cytochrome domain-containing protein [Cyclobacteriaceae bacterium]
VAVVSFIAILLNGGTSQRSRRAYYISLATLGVLTIAAGHTGASMTYGQQYLNPSNINTESSSEFSSTDKTMLLYADLVKPMLEKKCTSCHGPSRQKAKLRLDAPDFIKRGGEDGEVLNAAFPEEGELWRRIMLDPTNDDHMPPIEKPQLSNAEISLIIYWLQNGADFNATLGALPNADSLITALTLVSRSEVVQEHVDMPDPDIVAMLRKVGVTVSFLSKEDGRVALQFINARGDSISPVLGALSAISTQVVEIKIPNHQLSHEDWKRLTALPNVQRLSVENSNFSDEDLSAISGMTRLTYLNLAGTAVTARGLQQISLPQLRHLYLFRTGVGEGDIAKLKSKFPGAELVLGNFQVPTFKSDTTEQKEKYVVPER